jgi:copper chaperone NosL
MSIGARDSRAAVLLAFLMMSGCGRRDLRPQAIPLDRVNCARCGMLVSDTASAAEAVFADSDPLFYDDLGCLASARIAADRRVELWVRVDDGRAWSKASEAFYAKAADARTPMGYGILAFSSPERARARDRESRARSWREIEQEAPARSVRPVDSTGREGA